MTAFLVTGWSGSGKSTVRTELVRRGLHAIDTDEHPGLAHWLDESGSAVLRPDRPDADWLAAHLWAWDVDLLDRLIADAVRSGRPIILCGNAGNETSLFDRFDAVYMLRIDLATLRRRLDDPARTNTFGRSPDVREVLERRLDEHQEMVEGAGAYPIDALPPISAVVDRLLDLTNGHISSGK